MLTGTNAKSYCLCLYILVVICNNMRFSCEIHNDNSPDSWNDIQDSDLRLLFMSSTIEASCDTSRARYLFIYFSSDELLF